MGGIINKTRAAIITAVVFRIISIKNSDTDLTCAGVASKIGITPYTWFLYPTGIGLYFSHF